VRWTDREQALHPADLASRFEVVGMPVWVCDPREVLDRIPDPPRRKDRERAAAYAAVGDRLRNGG
jgi:hypothetical protein